MDFSKELSKFETDSKEYNFFKKIFEKLEPNGIRKSVKERQTEVNTKLCEVQQEYFQKHILNNAIFVAAEEYKSQENNAESKYAAFKKSIEDNINDFCKKLVTSTGGVILPGEDWQDAFDRTIKDLESKVILVASQEARQQLRNKQLREMIKTYCEELSKGVSLLSKALSLTEDRLKFESDFADLYHLRCHAVSLKLKCCELKILQHTYDQETMPALKKISAHLYQTEQKLNEDFNEKSATLESYLKLGEDYECLVDEYTNLVKSIEGEKWAIDELKTRKSQYGQSSRN